MLGDSIKRRKGKGPQKPREKSLMEWVRFEWTGAFSPLRWALLALAILVVSYGVGYVVATQLVFPRPETAGAGVAVPDLYGQLQEEAQAQIRDAGLVPGEVTPMQSTGADTGRVLAQTPLPGQQLLPGAEVSLAVSAGPPELRVPPLAGLGEATARELLEDLGFQVEVVQTRDTVPVGVVARAEPPAGTAQRLPVTVTLVVSTGPPDAASSNTVPDTTEVP